MELKLSWRGITNLDACTLSSLLPNTGHAKDNLWSPQPSLDCFSNWTEMQAPQLWEEKTTLFRGLFYVKEGLQLHSCNRKVVCPKQAIPWSHRTARRTSVLLLTPNTRRQYEWCVFQGTYNKQPRLATSVTRFMDPVLILHKHMFYSDIKQN